jgi:hypothetical protein
MKPAFVHWLRAAAANPPLLPLLLLHVLLLQPLESLLLLAG